MPPKPLQISQEPNNNNNSPFFLNRLVFSNYEDSVKEAVEFLTPFISHTFDTQRITVAAIFAAFISCCEARVDLLSTLVNAVLVRLGDSELKVKRLVLRGLGNVADCGETEVNRYATTILSALMHGMDDPKSDAPEIILEALSGLSKVMETVHGNNVVAILVNICVKLRPYFEAVSSVSFPNSFGIRDSSHNPTILIFLVCLIGKR